MGRRYLEPGDRVVLKKHERTNPAFWGATGVALVVPNGNDVTVTVRLDRFADVDVGYSPGEYRITPLAFERIERLPDLTVYGLNAITRALVDKTMNKQELTEAIKRLSVITRKASLSPEDLAYLQKMTEASRVPGDADPFGNDARQELEVMRRKYEEQRRDAEQVRAQYRELSQRADPGQLEKLKEQLKQLNEFVGGLQEKPQVITTVQKRLGKKHGLIVFQGSPMRVNLPDGCEAGDQVSVLTETGQPTEKVEEPVAFGAIVTVDRVEGGRCYYEGSGGGQTSAYLRKGMQVAPGERVELDPSGTVALVNLGRDKSKYTIEECPDIGWDDIGGHAEAKEAFREAIEYPTTYRQTYLDYGAKPSKGVLLYGPPGTGKTLLAKAAANSVSKGGKGAFIYVKGPELLSKWVGESETQVKALFSRARAHRKETGNVALLFIDEADALLGVRGGTRGESNALTSTLVPAFLTEMDGIEDSAAFVVLATNRPDVLDPAVVRDGRIDRRIRIGRPNRAEARTILDIALRGRPLYEVDPEAVMETMWSPQFDMYHLEFESREVRIGLPQLLSGAAIVGFVNRAVMTAIRRDRGQKTGGLRTKDLTSAITESFEELRAVNPMNLFLEQADLYGPPRSIRRVSHAGTEKEALGQAVTWEGRVQRQSAGSA